MLHHLFIQCACVRTSINVKVLLWPMDKSIWYLICKYKDIKHDKYKHKTISVFPIYLLEHPRRHLGYIALNKESVRAIMSVICLRKEMSLFGFCISHQKVAAIYQSHKKDWHRILTKIFHPDCWMYNQWTWTCTSFGISLLWIFSSSSTLKLG